MAQRIQRKRSEGWRMPENTVVVDRSGPFGNPFVIGSIQDHPLEHLGKVQVRDAHHAMVLFDNWLLTTAAGRALAERGKKELRGKNVACWCKLDQPCHGDVWLRVVNKRA
jgi:Domain of unknown function (DUF4326)